MNLETKKNEYDASQYILGRLTAEVAEVLQGKKKPDYEPAKVPKVKVTIFNSDKVKISGDKRKKSYRVRHSGYPGHLKTRFLGDEMEKDSTEVIKKTIYNMLPKNRLRYQMMKNLSVYKDKPGK